MNVLITGASGLVATELISLLLPADNSTELILVSRRPDLISDRFSAYRDRITSITFEQLINGNTITPDICIHTAFARSSSGDQLVESLDYTVRLCTWIRKKTVKRFVNISSQSVYGNSYEPLANENTPCAPSYMYALAKYSAEKICQSIFTGSNTALLNIRLSSVCENARFMKVFVDNALNNRPIVITAPNQIVSFIDVRDVAEALRRIIYTPSFNPGDYNLGSGEIYSIKEVSLLVKEIGERYYGLSNVDVQINDNGNESRIGMNIEKITNTYNWHPKFDIKAMITYLYEMLTNVNGGGYPIAFKLLYS